MTMRTGLNKAEPDPVPNDGRPSWELVIEDMHERHRAGMQKYGTPLQAGNGRNSLVDAYQEALDKTVYLRTAITERALALKALADVVAEMRVIVSSTDSQVDLAMATAAWLAVLETQVRPALA